MAEPTQPLLLTFTGGINNLNTDLDLFTRKQGECTSFTNIDSTLLGRLKLLRPKEAVNSTALAEIHSGIRVNDWVLVGASTILYYIASDGTAFTSLITGLSGDRISFCHAGNWVYLADGTNKHSVYIGGTTPTACSWGLAVPAAAPTVAAGAAGNPDGTYSCYYRYRITLPDSSIILTGLSPVASAVVASEKIEWSALVHASYTGATTVQIDIIRTLSGWADDYIITTIDEGTTTYSDDVTDTVAQASTEFSEDGYYPPPSSIDLVAYHSGADRVFCADGGDIYWSVASSYNVFVYDTSADEYTNVNSVYLSGENIKAMLVYDEQLYIGSLRTWTRLRGTNPSYWTWEAIGTAIKGPNSHSSVAVTPWGIVYTGNDSYIWLFNGFQTQRIAEYFILPTAPGTTCHATFDGRFYRLFYDDTTNPLLILDFLGFAGRPIRVIESTQDMSFSFYDQSSNELYFCDADGYMRNGTDSDTEVTLTFKTAEIPVEQLVNLGNAASLLIEVNTQGEELTITPYQDGTAQDALDVVTTDSLERQVLPLPLNTYRTIALGVTITTSEDIEIREPWLVRKEDDADF